ncbi:MAG: family efflux transporter, subunit [Hyphomicrobiales bacterium]|nr:family efflux transporter, subunit [Hyphomicrobiales bacterium]
MKSGKVAWSFLGLGAAAVAAAVVWPGQADRVVPGAGERAAALRNHLPSALVGSLPAYGQAAAPPAAGGRPTAANGQSGRPQSGPGGGAGGPASRPPAPVVLDKAVRGPMAVIVDAVGTVQPIATVALKSRVDAQIQEVLVADGATVKQGQILARLDSRQIEAQIKQAEASLARNQTTLEQAQRDVGRYEELLSKNSGTRVNLDNARTQVAAAKALMMGDTAQIENLKVQLTYYTIRAPIPGRIGTFNVKAGNIIRSGDNAATGTLATIVQTKPIYVAFSVPQRLLGELRTAVSNGGAAVEALPQGASAASKGKIAFVDNAIDSATGTVTVRAEFENDDERLWAGQLCNLRINLRTEQDVVSVPREATQAGQIGNFVYVIENGVARVRQVTVGRTQDGRDVVTKGLEGGETVVIEGALALVNGSRVEPRPSASKRDS